VVTSTFEPSEVCEADEAYVTAGEQGCDNEDSSPRSRRLKKGDFEGDKPPVLTLVRRSDGQVRFLVCKNLKKADEEIAAHGGGRVILCTDGYLICENIE